MAKTLVISERHTVGVVYKSDKVLTDVIIEQGKYRIGNIYIGIVEKVLSSINAAFIILDSSELNGFIHINNLGHLRKNVKSNNIANHLCINSVVMVQVLKEPNGHKGPTMTGTINLRGRYLTLFPFQSGIFFSQNFDSNEILSYFKALFTLLKPECIGILINRSALYTNSYNIIQEFYSLLYEWDSICKNIYSSLLPILLTKNEHFLSKILKKVYTEKIDSIIIDKLNSLKKAVCLVNRLGEKKGLILSIKYFENYNFFIRDYNLDLVVYNLLQSRINLFGGAYIVIEKSEALTTIDVNSGAFNYLNNPRETILLVNKKAAKQIAINIKLRDLSGVIIIDFIDMPNQKDQLELLIYFNSFLKQDDGKPKIMQFSELGLVELIRKRQGQCLDQIFFNDSYSHSITRSLSKFSLGHVLFFETFSSYSL